MTAVKKKYGMTPIDSILHFFFLLNGLLHIFRLRNFVLFDIHTCLSTYLKDNLENRYKYKGNYFPEE